MQLWLVFDDTLLLSHDGENQRNTLYTESQNIRLEKIKKFIYSNNIYANKVIIWPRKINLQG